MMTKFLDDGGLKKVFELIKSNSTKVEEIQEDTQAENTDVLYLNPNSKTIQFNKNTYKTFSWAVFEEQLPYMEVVFYNKNTENIEVVGDPELWDVENTIPIGIIVVPASHNVYGTGEAGVMSLVNMSWQTPDVGDIGLPENNDGSLFYFGSIKHGLTTSQSFPVQGRCNEPVQISITEYVATSAQLPIDKTTLQSVGPQCLTDKTTFYGVEISESNSNRGWAPSPYGSRETRNPLYYYGGKNANSLARFDGASMTESLVSLATAQEDWKTDETLLNNTDDNNYPVACSCWRFHTEGTKQGDWYLPEIGELGYVPPRYKKIDDTLELINQKFGQTYTSPINYIGNNYYSSTVTSNGACRISTLNGSLGSQNAASKASVRAFFRIMR